MRAPRSNSLWKKRNMNTICRLRNCHRSDRLRPSPQVLAVVAGAAISNGNNNRINNSRTSSRINNSKTSSRTCSRISNNRTKSSSKKTISSGEAEDREAMERAASGRSGLSRLLAGPQGLCLRSKLQSLYVGNQRGQSRLSHAHFANEFGRRFDPDLERDQGQHLARRESGQPTKH